MPSGARAFDSPMSPGSSEKFIEERRLLDVGAVGIPLINVPVERRDFVPLRILRGEIRVELRNTSGLRARLHGDPDFLQRRPDVLRKTRLPSLPLPIGSVVRSISTRPASAKATTSGGDMRKFALMLGWTRASKLRLPLKHGGGDEVVFSHGIFDGRGQRAGVANAGGAAIADEVESRVDPGTVAGRSSSGSRSPRGARRERGLDDAD